LELGLSAKSPTKGHMNGKTLILIMFSMKIGLVSAHHNLGTSYFEYEENPVEFPAH